MSPFPGLNYLFSIRSFTKLDAYLKSLQDDAAALVVASGNKKLKRKDSKQIDDDNKKKAKSKTSHGVDKLKKANINGMAKMSSFFTKKTM